MRQRDRSGMQGDALPAELELSFSPETDPFISESVIKIKQSKGCKRVQ